jgi:hypothetical protein
VTVRSHEEFRRRYPGRMPKACISCGAPARGSRCSEHGASGWDKYAHKHPERARLYKDSAWTARRRA